MPQYNLPEDLFYTPEHIWVRQEGDELVLGITDFAQSQLEEVVYADVPNVGAPMEAEKEFGSLESMKTVSALFAPVGGTVTAVNGDLENTPALINQDCYGKGWIARVCPKAPADLHALLCAEQYARLLPQNSQA